MRCRLVTLVVPLVWTLWTPAGGARAGPPAWPGACEPPILAAERFYRLPAGILEAIALTESGSHGAPYPWALNLAGRPVMSPSRDAAAGLLRGPNGIARRDVAVGCMQIHMRYHLAGFAKPESALEPARNVWYGAAFLDGLHRRLGDWASAIAQYHASDPKAQRAYVCRVAGQLAHTGPLTRQALGLDLCGSPPIAGLRLAGRQAPLRLSLFTARQSAGIVVMH
jgi:hypothetical protein